MATPLSAVDVALGHVHVRRGRHHGHGLVDAALSHNLVRRGRKRPHDLGRHDFSAVVMITAMTSSAADGIV